MPEPKVADDTGGTTFPIFYRRIYGQGILMTPNFWLQRAYEEDEVIAVLMNEYTEEVEEREVDQLVIENGIIPNDSLYWSLREESSNGGIIEINELYDHQPQPALSNIPKASSRCSVLGIASASTTFTGRFMTPFGSQRTSRYESVDRCPAGDRVYRVRGGCLLDG